MESSGVPRKAKISSKLNLIGYKSTESDPDIWIKRATTENSTTYYKYVLVYFDDVLHLSKDAQEDMLKLNRVNLLKEGFGPPYRYLGANVNEL